MNNREMYDSLIDRIDDSIRVTEVLSGHVWTILKNDACGYGMAMTTMADTRPRTSMDYIGMKLKDVAECVRSWNFIEAGIGMAAINSFYNTEERMRELESEQKDRRFCTFDVPLARKKVGMVGHLRYDPGIFDGAAELHIIEMNCQEGDYPSSASEYILPDCDVVIITGSAFTNKTMPRLLELAKDAFTIVTGPSTPMCIELLADYPIDRLCGFIPADKDELWKMISAGCMSSPYVYGKRFVLE